MGLSFMIANQLSISASINVILQVPLQAPVMKRELANKMYSPTAYFLGRYLSTLVIQLLYPLIMLTLLFWMIGIDTSFDNLLWMVCYGVLSNYAFCGQGYFMGILVLNEDAVKVVNFLVIMFWMTSNGVLANLQTANWFIRGLSTISPMRYTTEGFLRRMTMQIPDLTDAKPYPLPIDQQNILDKFDYKHTDSECVLVLVYWCLGWIALSLILINIKFRKL